MQSFVRTGGLKFSANGVNDKLAHLKRWAEMKNVSNMCSVFKGYVPGLFGVSYGTLQFMAYEKLKKDYSNTNNNNKFYWKLENN